MPLAYCFWILLLLWMVLSLYWGYRTDRAAGFAAFAPVGANVLAFVLIFLLGVAVFGWPVKG